MQRDPRHPRQQSGLYEKTIKEERHEDMTKDRKTEKEREKEKNNGRKEQCMKSNKERNKNTKK